jgi:predicted  nucleic acid-binding Zn-ribbon protein
MSGSPAAFAAHAFNNAAFQTGPAASTASSPTYGARPADAAEYERKVRAHYDRIEALEDQRREREAEEQRIADRLADQQRQLADLEAKRARKAQEKRSAAAVKRRQKLAAEIERLEAELAQIGEQIAAVIALLIAAQEELAEAERARLLLADRRRRMVLLLAVAA